MNGLAKSRTISLLQWIIIFLVAPLWGLQILVTTVVIAAPGTNNNWLPYAKNDFTHYYRTSQRIVQGSPQAYCHPFSDNAGQGTLNTNDINQPTNPPLLSLLLSPLAYLPPAFAWALLSTLSLVATFGSLALFIRARGAAGAISSPYLLVAIALSSPVLTLLVYSQVQGIIMAILLLALHLFSRRPSLSGALIGLTIALKGFTAPLLAFLFMSRHYRVFLVALSTAIIFSLLPGAIDPRLSMLPFLECGAHHVGEWALKNCNQSVFGIAHTIAQSPWFRGGAIPTADIVLSRVAPLLWLGSGALLGLLYRRGRGVEDGFVAAVALCVLCAPLAWVHYYVLVWPFLIAVWGEVSRGSKLILWFSMPLMPWLSGAHGAPELGSLSVSPENLVAWLPGAVFMLQFLVVMCAHITRASPQGVGSEPPLAT